MKQARNFSGALVTALAAMLATPAFGDDPNLSGNLTGYEETPATINSAGSAEFSATISKDGTAIMYQETYRDLSSPVTQSHIHFGRPGLTGGIVLFLCTNLGNAPASVPTPQLCPPFPATISGTLTAADVIPLPGQGIDAAATGFAEMLNAFRAGAAYVNVHTTGHPSGEVRAVLRSHGDEEGS
jgi:CHRD domain